MKRLICEMCGGTDLIKKDGMYVCETCGTKYSVEEAKKMMIEGVVDVSGSAININNSDQIENWFKLAKRKSETGIYSDLDDVEKYCDKILEYDADYYKAMLLKLKACEFIYSVKVQYYKESIKLILNLLGKTDKSIVDDEGSQLLYDCIIAIADTEKSMDDFISDRVLSFSKIILEESKDILEKCGISFNDLRDQYISKAYSNSVVFWNWALNSSSIQYESLDESLIKNCEIIEYLFGVSDKNSEFAIKYYRDHIAMNKVFLQRLSNYLIYARKVDFSTMSVTEKDKCRQPCKETLIKQIMEYHNEIKKLDPEHVIPPESDYEHLRDYTEPASGCYVATAVYGSYDCPEVWTLRRFRDYSLASTWYGRLFIRMYYTLSPSLVKWFGDTYWFKRMWRGKLDKIVQKLQEKGYESTPYNDRIW